MAVIAIGVMSTELIGIKKSDDYNLYSSPFIVAHSHNVVEAATNIHTKFIKLFGPDDTTTTYYKYNIFTMTAGDPYFYTIFRQISAAIRDKVGDDRPLWMEAWLNYHKEDEVLDWHTHDEDYLLHGYLSIEPMNTVTEFKNFTIENKVGNLYVGKTGPGFAHAVKVREPYGGDRITFAFDVIDSTYANELSNLSFIPIP